MMWSAACGAVIGVQLRAVQSISAVRPSDVQTWVGTMHDSGLSASRIRKAVVVLRLVLGSAVRDGLILHNAAEGVKLGSGSV
jgi:site-specific recombinase XerC